MTGEGRRCEIIATGRKFKGTFIGWTRAKGTPETLEAVVELDGGGVLRVDPAMLWMTGPSERVRAKLVQAKGYERLYCSGCKRDLTYGQDQYFCRFCGAEFVDHGVVFAEEDVAERERQKDAGARDVR